ncbi:hypothetical protein [Butyricicoccus sp.]|uniref:hypothetical protein n=1 Tax=Butyricicoccus sp. TaxID=2049021 RepID=UPI003F139905
MSAANMNAAQLQGTLGAASLSGTLSAGSVVINDYVIKIESIEGGHRLSVTRGSKVQMLDLLDGAPGEPGMDAPQEAVLYTAQELSEEQQSAARENISAASAGDVDELKDNLDKKVASVNGAVPDENGNVRIEIPEDISGNYEEFVFTLEDGTTVTKKVLVAE